MSSPLSAQNANNSTVDASMPCDSIATEVDIHGLVGSAGIQDTYDAIRAREQEIMELRKHFNTLLPIWTLPDDVMVEIFFCLAVEEYDEYWDTGYYGGVSPYGRWIHVTLVCRRWRDLVLHHPRLWSFVTLIGHGNMLSHVTRALANAREAELHLQARWEAIEEISRAPFERMLEAFPRARSIRMVYRGCVPNQQLNLLEDHSAPILENLSLHFIRHTGTVMVLGDPHQDPFLGFMMALSTPSLKHVSLAGGTRHLCHIMLRPTITSLTLLIDYADWVNHLDVLLELLRGLPLLDRLKLLDLPELTDFPRQQLPPFAYEKTSLPHLRSLEVESSRDYACALFLKHITFPHTSAVSICFNPELQPTESPPRHVPAHAESIMQRLWTLLLSHYKSQPLHLYLLLDEKSFSGGSEMRISLTKYRGEKPSQSRRDPPGDQGVDAEKPLLELQSYFLELSPYLETIVNNLPLSEVRSIEFDTDTIKTNWGPYPEPRIAAQSWFWTKIFSKGVENVTSFHLRGEISPIGLLEALQPQMGVFGDEGRGGLLQPPVFFPSLKNLKIEAELSDKSTESVIDTICQTLRLRNQWSRQTIDEVHCSFTVLEDCEPDEDGNQTEEFHRRLSDYGVKVASLSLARRPAPRGASKPPINQVNRLDLEPSQWDPVPGAAANGGDGWGGWGIGNDWNDWATSTDGGWG